MKRRSGLEESARWIVVVACALSVGAGAGDPVRQAEALAEQARAAATSAEALTLARRGLALTTEFDPVAFVKAGRKGEVVEDAFQEARRGYRLHRALLYAAVGEALVRAGRNVEAARYLRRAVDLGGPFQVSLARALLATARPREALDFVLGLPDLGPDALAVATSAADACGLASLQAEIDRVRLLRARAEPLDGPVHLPERAHLSTGGPLRFDDRLVLLYVAEASCRSCTADVVELRRLAPRGARVVVAAAKPEQDQSLRQALSLYRADWPLLLGHGGALGVTPPAVLAVTRGGWSAGVVHPPLADTLPGLLEVLSRTDVSETLPRGAWNGRPAERPQPAPRPELLPEGLAPGEDWPAPPEFNQALAAWRAGRPADALAAFDALASRGDGWLLPPEARFDRALCLARLGRREEGRLLLLRIGDSRFQDAVDRALEQVGSRR